MDDTGQNFCHPIELKIFPSAQSDFFPPARQGPKRLSLDTFVRRRPTLASQTAKHRTHQSPSQIHISYDTRVPPVRGSRAVPVPMSLLHVRRRVPEQSEGMAKPAFDLEKRLAGLDFFALAGVDRNEFRLHIRQLAVRPPRSKSPPVSRLRLNTCSGPKKQNRCAVAQKLPRSKKQRDTSVMMSRTSQVAKRALNLSSNCSVGPVRSKETGKQPKPRVATEKRRVRHRPKPSLPPDEPVPEHDHSSKLQPIPTFVAQDYDYCFKIFPGNNSQIIRRCLEKRMDYWKEVPNFNAVFNFQWRPFSRGIRFAQLSCFQRQAVNHFEFHAEITTKDQLFRNLLSYAQLNKMNVFDFVPLTFAIDLTSHTYNPDFEKFVTCFNIISSAQSTSDKKSPSCEQQCLKTINSKLQLVTFSRDRRAVSHCKAKIAETHFAGKNLWILKPTGFNRGQGVSVFDSMDVLKGLIKFYSEGPDKVGDSETISKSKVAPMDQIKSKTFVIQKYIERPLLLRGRKFDIRVWTLVTQEMKVYFFREGYLRTSSSVYSTDEATVCDRNVHLTNNAVQKYGHGYGQFEDGNQLSFDQFQSYLDQTYPERKVDVYGDLVKQMKDLVVVTMQSVRKKLNAEDRFYCFELFGYDFFIDEQFKVWLIEVNTNPCLEESSALLRSLLPRMIDDMMKLTLDQVFPRRHWRNTSGASDSEGRKVEWTHPVKNHADGENMWEFLCQIGLVRSVPRMRTKANATELAAEEDNTKGEAESIK